MDYTVRIEDKEYLFSISGSGSALKVSRNGESLPIDFRSVGPGAYSLLIQGRAHLVTTLRDARGLTVRVDGRAYTAEVGRKDSTGAAGETGDLREDEREVRSVMPGVVTRLLVRPGDPVEPDTPLLALEAMKMENEVRAHRHGEVEAVHVSEGEVVEVSQLLMTIR